MQPTKVRPPASTRERRNLVEAIGQRREAVGSKLDDHSRLWKVELQQLTRETGLALHIASPSDGHIDVAQHRTPLFCRITQSWRGRRLLNRVALVELIAVTTTKRTRSGRAVDSAADEKRDQMNDVEMEALAI
ncbi:hypothetical protein NKJ73_14890 [Mesorhizobium sp. M0074]|uniref:ISAzo13-like element transposase-related protein n=1 Tax=unclassified Mesorhizobium TaxID=325217 RepID=UPI00333D97B2